MMEKPKIAEGPEMAAIPVGLINEVITFISTHRGITIAEGIGIVDALRSNGEQGKVMWSMIHEKFQALQTENISLHQKIEELQKQGSQT